MNPVFRTTRFRKGCKFLNDIFSNKIYRLFIKPFLFILPITLLITILADSGLCNQLESMIGKTATDTLKNSQLFLVILTFLLITLGNSIESFIRQYSEPDLELARDDIHSILTSINEVVSAKKSRFLKTTKQALLERWDKKTIFTEITQPEQQISLLIKALHGIFTYLFHNEVNFRVGLMSIKNNQPVEWFCFEPEEHPPRTGPDTLSSSTSSIMRALESKSMVIVSDTVKEFNKPNKDQRNFVKGSSGPKEDGSILTFPILCPNTREAIYVLSILAKQKNCLETKNKDLYFWIIDIFLSRLLLEHHLMLLKSNEVNENEN